MNYVIIMPAYNEQDFIYSTLQSIVKQSVQPTELIIVDDNSTDNTISIARDFAQSYPWIKVIHKASQSSVHLPGSKVIQAFNFGLKLLELDNIDIIVKLDADLILPSDYFEQIILEFNNNPKAGIVGGFAYIKNKDKWIKENLTDSEHVRGAFKAYRKQCFIDINALQAAMGWDTVDELLARYYHWQVVTLKHLKVKHLKPTGANYDKTARYKQGSSFYALRYGLAITAIAAIKLASKKNKPLLFIDYIKGYYKAKKEKQPFLATEKQGEFIRKYRWTKMKEKIKKSIF